MVETAQIKPFELLHGGYSRRCRLRYGDLRTREGRMLAGAMKGLHDDLGELNAGQRILIDRVKEKLIVLVQIGRFVDGLPDQFAAGFDRVRSGGSRRCIRGAGDWPRSCPAARLDPVFRAAAADTSDCVDSNRRLASRDRQRLRLLHYFHRRVLPGSYEHGARRYDG